MLYLIFDCFCFTLFYFFFSEKDFGSRKWLRYISSVQEFIFWKKLGRVFFMVLMLFFSVWNSIVYCVEGSQTFTLEQVVSPLLVQRIRIYLEFDLAVCLFIVVTTAHLPFSLSVPDLKAFYLLLIRKTFKTKKGNFYAKQ